jgi:RNA polymerase sigma-70 factor (ECF subfamily)
MNEIESLYRQHASALFRFAWGLCGDRSQAEDIVSETFIRILTRAPRIETQTALAYLLAVARNVFLTGGRVRRREVPLPEEIRAPELDANDRLDNQASLACVLRALRCLPEGERSALLLRVDHELSYEDVASALGTSVVAAKVRVHRARLRLASMARQGSDGPGKPQEGES